MLAKAIRRAAKHLLKLAQEDVASRWKLYDYLAARCRRTARQRRQRNDRPKTIDLSTRTWA